MGSVPIERYTGRSNSSVRRLRRILSVVRLDCRCRETLSDALDCFEALEHRRALRSARLCRDQIAVQLTFLAELDEISEFETDRTVFEELALVFDEIGVAAAEAAKEIRSTEQPFYPGTYADNVQPFDTSR